MVVQAVGSKHVRMCEVSALMTYLIGVIPLDTEQQTKDAMIMDILTELTDCLKQNLKVLKHFNFYYVNSISILKVYF